MVHISVELWPGGSRTHPRARVLCSAEIENVGGTATSGDYRFRLFGKNRRLMKSGDVKGYRRVADHTWTLVRMVLDIAYQSKHVR